MKIYLLIIFLLTINCSNKKNDPINEDISDLIELSLNICKDVEQYYHFELKERRNIKISFKDIKNPLTRKIKCYGIIVDNKGEMDEDTNLIEVLEYQKTSDKFYILYKIPNQGVVVETTIKYKFGQWELSDCSVLEQ
ncbi:hypothetical protein N0B16_06575 [Chryseobacterium sp. GMJ5]|uniref:Lipoprotein n=1 Tax=Chryseobacterium gilvum TaxID=2976534 RepID=A0ABT2VVS6_9FLAO|nr:hypothetical protein [Chryseobacterium gilvum]MCU7614097.1 hypothetical protein [Chryseobacterium gilvum]